MFFGRTCMNAIKSISFLLLYALITQASSNDDINHYEKAFSILHSEYEQAYGKLNNKIEQCNLRIEIDYDSTVGKIPKGLSKQQLNSALFILEKQQNDKCISNAVGMYVSKASNLKRAIKIAQKEKIKIKSSGTFIPNLIKIRETEELLFYTPDSYFKMLSEYHSIRTTDRKKLESIQELQSNYNMVKLMEALKKKYVY